jgi:hypothetical protein
LRYGVVALKNLIATGEKLCADAHAVYGLSGDGTAAVYAGAVQVAAVDEGLIIIAAVYFAGLPYVEQIGSSEKSCRK